MLRSIALGTLFAFFLVRTPAATINVSVTCNNSTSTANGTTSANASCDSGDGASASASATTFSVYVTKATKRPLPDNFAAAQAATSTEVQIAITGGTGSGWYVPCLSVFFRFIGEGSANFGPVDFGPQTPGGGDSCSYARGNLDLTNPIINSLLIPFVFDTPQIQEVSLSAQTGGILTMGLAFASFNGNILVFDSKGQPVPTANFTVTEIPEPTPPMLLAVPLLAIALFKRRQENSCRRSLASTSIFWLPNLLHSAETESLCRFPSTASPVRG